MHKIGSEGAFKLGQAKKRGCVSSLPWRPILPNEEESSTQVQYWKAENDATVKSKDSYSKCVTNFILFYLRLKKQARDENVPILNRISGLGVKNIQLNSIRFN